MASAHYLPGPPGKGYAPSGQLSRSAHFAGGRLRAQLSDVGDTYSVEFWFWNGLPNDARPVTGYLFSRGPNHDRQARGDHLGIGGTKNSSGRLIFFNGSAPDQILDGHSTIEPKTWNNIVLVRNGPKVLVYLNGRDAPEIVGLSGTDRSTISNEWFFGGRNDNFANLEGKLSEVAIYDRQLAPIEVMHHYDAAGMPAK